MGEKMTNAQAAEILRQHNAWRRGNDDEMPDAPVNPTRLGKAIDHAVAHLTQPAQAVDVFEPIPEAVDAPTDELWNAYNAFNDRFCGFNTQQALRDAINTVLASRKERAALPNANGKEG